MKLTISAAQFNDSGICISLENPDGNSLTIYQADDHRNVLTATQEVIKELTVVQSRLRELATAEKPFHQETHDRINNL